MGERSTTFTEQRKDWLIGPELKGNKAALRNKKRLEKCLLPTTGWEYTRKRTWQPDSSLTISKVSTITPVRSMGICSQVILRGNSRLTKSSHVIDTDSLGLYKRTSDWSMGRPVYKHRTSGWVLLVPSGLNLWSVKA